MGLHKASGQMRVVVEGKTFYLGKPGADAEAPRGIETGKGCLGPGEVSVTAVPLGEQTGGHQVKDLAAPF